MPDLTELATTIESAAESLAGALDPSGCREVSSVSPAQLRVLLLLRARPSLNVNGLAAALNVGPSSASRLCDRLEALGLAARTPDPRDRREMQLSLTAAAIEMLGALTRYRLRALEAILAAMPRTARAELARSLSAFSATTRQFADAEENGADRRRSA